MLVLLLERVWITPVDGKLTSGYQDYFSTIAIQNIFKR
jgi:hypothetical protein